MFTHSKRKTTDTNRFHNQTLNWQDVYGLKLLQRLHKTHTGEEERIDVCLLIKRIKIQMYWSFCHEKEEIH